MYIGAKRVNILFDNGKKCTTHTITAVSPPQIAPVGEHSKADPDNVCAVACKLTPLRETNH